MVEHILFAISAGIVTISTNLDNLVMLFGLVMVMKTARAVIGFAVAQVLILSLSLAIASGLDQTSFLHWVGYLGIVPLALGLRGIWHQMSGKDDHKIPERGAVTSVVVLFLSLSIDTLAAMTPLLADSTPAFRVTALIGAAFALTGLIALASWGAPRAQNLGPRIARLDRIAPYIMVSVGLYILINSPTDAM
ncbi:MULTISPECIES: hypothetical protein [unclassified Ruegeria]|uniref:hypothetical protein n=1 Tax=unclassified Ruegeria TaxID=2625375 RepID=UPI00148A0721|nr:MULTISPECIES: hypothetical protein [unclassified Ruegeria]